MAAPSSTIELQSGPLSLRILPHVAGRVERFDLEGVPLLSTPEQNPANYGSTYWTSPQSDWGWPPIAEIDSVPFEVLETSPPLLRGPRAPLCGSFVRLEKRVRALEATAGFEFGYSLENVGERPVTVAGWQITRVLGGGLSFFPVGDHRLTPIAPHGALRLLERDGVYFYDHREFELGRSTKVHADGREGFLAHVTAPVGGRRALFVKAMSDAPSSAQAPGEGEVELFANEDGRYIELEVQGRYQEIAPGQKRTFSVRWGAVWLPDNVRVAVGAAELMEHARELRARLGTPEA